MKQMKVLIVDDSLLFRELLQQELMRDINVLIVDKAADPYEASEKIVKQLPDVLVVDVIMGKMNGIEFIRQLLPQYFLPVIMISSDPENRAKAEAIRTVTFIEKPSEVMLRHTDLFFSTILARIRTIANEETFSLERIGNINGKIIALGASTGGAEAIETVLTALPSTMPPIVISQHMPPVFTKSFAERLNAQCRLSVKEAEDGEIVIPGQVYIAPGGQHMTVRRRSGRYSIRCESLGTRSAVAPNIDALFNSVAASAARDAIGVLMTGMGKDGAKGLLEMRLAGAQTIGQDEMSSVVYGMPKAAYDLGAVSLQLPLAGIAKKLVDLSWNHASVLRR